MASLPYDVMNADEARAMAAGNPKSFLHVVRSEIDFDPEHDPHDPSVYAKARENLDALISSGDLIRENVPSFYLYQQKINDRHQTAIVACCEIDDYANGTILRHEKTRKDKEDDRFHHILATNANTGQVFLAYRDNATIDSLVSAITQTPPLYDFTADDNVRHTVWRMADDTSAATQAAFQDIPKAYIADGHHRSAASYRAGINVGRVSDPPPVESIRLMTCLFPASQLTILPYNRLIKDLNGLTSQQFLDQLSTRFTVTPSASPTPTAPCSCAFYLAGKWRTLSWTLTPAQKSDPVESLDVSRLQNDLLAPILGIGDPRTDPRISFSGGIRGTDELAAAVDSGAAAIAFSMFSTTLEQVMSISDAGQIMPPKSTWFEPKLRSGLLIHTLD
ncbi:MAG: DUF1015 family protein [Kiritimatiellaeota bacterium]|nr:DUF1015 family protein [Kiritimatiellota bacterium]